MIDLSGISLDDVMLRLSDSETNVCALASYSSEGWQTKLAWNPAKTFRLNSDEVAATDGIERFVEIEQAKGNMVVGYLSYDFGCQLRGVELASDDDLNMPLLFAASFDSWLEFDDSGAHLAGNIDGLSGQLEQIANRQPLQLTDQPYQEILRPTLSRDDYNQAYQRIQDYITAGDVYQINLAHRLKGKTKLGGRELFCRLGQGSQPGFCAYIEDGETEVLSYSPERFIEVTGSRIQTSPIKGTRPRGKSDSNDAEIKQDLLNSPKDRAELDMITDLMRNDLGQICKVGSVQVAERRALTGYPTLWHASSLVVGQLQGSVSPIGALCSVSPGGSITGCPKRRAMQIIDELETKRRGVYTGSVFVIQPNGNLDSNIAIRTLVKKGDDLYLSVGGGIVHDSEQADEYQESLDKAASFI